MAGYHAHLASGLRLHTNVDIGVITTTNLGGGGEGLKGNRDKSRISAAVVEAVDT